MSNRTTNHYQPTLSPRIPIAFKLALAFIFLIAGGMVTLGIMAGKSQTELLEQQINQYGNSLVRQMVESAREPLLADDRLNLDLIVNNLIHDNNIEGAAVFAQDFVLIVRAGIIPANNTIQTAHMDGGSATHFTHSTRVTGQHTPYIAYFSPVIFRDITIGYVMLSFDSSLIQTAKQDIIGTVIGTISLMLILAIVLSLYLGKRFTRPVRELVTACESYGKGDFTYRIHDTRHDEIGILMDSLNRMGEELQHKELVKQVFSRYVSPKVAQQAIAGMDALGTLPLGGQHVDASVIFADIVGFTSLSEQLSPYQISELLNHYFSNIAKAVHFCHGHIDKYMGDCAMIVFGVPEADEDHSFKALACAWMILELTHQMNQLQIAAQKIPVEFRIGVNSGMMLAGNMGSAERMEYTVVGDAVNLASRLSHAGNPGQVILTEEMLARPTLTNRINTFHHGKIRLRGKSEPVSIFHLADINDPFRTKMIDMIRQIVNNNEAYVA